MADKRERDRDRDTTPGSVDKDADEDVDVGEGTLEVVLPSPPDGGWGWVIVVASLMANIIVDGITYTFGIFLPKFQQAFQQPKRTIALAGSLQVGTYLCVGPIVSALTNRYGCKKVTVAGSVIATFAFVVSTFSPSAHILIITYGVIGGFGFGMMYLPAIVIVGYYFERRRALATGIAVCGSGIGMFIMAPLSGFLLREFDWKGALLVIAGIVFNGAAAAGGGKSQANGAAPDVEPLMKADDSKRSDNSPKKPPTPEVLKPDVTRERQKFTFSSVPNIVFSSARPGAEKHGVPQTRRTRSNTMDNLDRIRMRHLMKEVTPSAPPSRRPIGLGFIALSDANVNKVRASTHLNVSRRDIFVSGSVLHIPDHNLTQSHIRSALSMKSYQSVASRAERVLCSCLPESARETLLQMLDFTILKNKAYVMILVGNIFAMLGFYVPFVFIPERATSLGIDEGRAAFLLSIIGITNTVGRVMTGVLANLNKIDSLVINNVAMLVCGLATFLCPFCDNYYLLSAYISLSSILLCDMLGVEQLTNAFGFLTLARGVSSCAGSPLAGAIIDETGDINLAFFVGGALIICGALCHFRYTRPVYVTRTPPYARR
ncbi:hypothetical protein BaRGS_00020749 [Batillaria attramentaria]|uniref:Monocarboxylate transporter n=1 Tax=Batillaria attramentaria TaxID=370345 RepID=A0ABD0KLK6_9CAEN